MTFENARSALIKTFRFSVFDSSILCPRKFEANQLMRVDKASFRSSGVCIVKLRSAYHRIKPVIDPVVVEPHSEQNFTQISQLAVMESVSGSVLMRFIYPPQDIKEPVIVAVCNFLVAYEHIAVDMVMHIKVAIKSGGILRV